MTRRERYLRQSEAASRSIEGWPSWLRNGITPSREDMSGLVEKPQVRHDASEKGLDNAEDEQSDEE